MRILEVKDILFGVTVKITLFGGKGKLLIFALLYNKK